MTTFKTGHGIPAAWGYDYMGGTRTVDMHVQRLRAKLGWEDVIKTVYKLVYQRVPGPIGSFASRGAGFGSSTGELLDMREVENQARQFGGDAAVDRLRDAVKQRDKLVHDTVRLMNQKGPMRFRVVSIGSVAVAHNVPSNNAPPFDVLTLQAILEESSGVRYCAEVRVDGDMETSLQSLHLLRPGP